MRTTSQEVGAPVVHWANVKKYVAPLDHFSNQTLQSVWLSED